jgi:ribosome-associated protein
LNAEETRDIAINALDDLKGREISCLKVTDVTTITDYMVVATGTSSRHVKSMADEVVRKIRENGGTVHGQEGQDQAEWVLIDLGDVIVHVMLEETRKMYDLESLWGMTPSTAQ